MDDGTWHHVGVTYDRDGNAQLYFDGVADGAAVDISGVNLTMNSGNDLLIGIRNGDTDDFTGEVDDVRLHKGVVQSAAWVKEYYLHTRVFY